MARTLYLHIGSHKTGTTSIQHFLVERKEELAKRGYQYPVSSNGVNMRSAIRNTMGADKEEEDLDASPTRKVVQLLRDSDAPFVIASAEGFSYLNDPDDIKSFARRLRRIFAHIKVITYLRRQDLFAVSHHQEGANPQNKPAGQLHGHRPTALPETSALQQKYLDYETRIGHWGDAFGDKNVIVRVYDRANLKNGDSVVDFLELVGLGDMDLGTPPLRNPSMGFVKTKLGHLLHQHLSDQQARTGVLRRLPDEGKLLPSRAAAKAFLEPYQTGNARLNRRFHILPGQPLFTEDFLMYPEEGAESWTEETANQALRACIETLEALSGQTFLFSRDEYATAARVLAGSHPELAERFQNAAKGLRAQFDAMKKKVDRVAKAAATPESTGPRKGKKLGNGQRLGKSAKGRAKRRAGSTLDTAPKQG